MDRDEKNNDSVKYVVGDEKGLMDLLAEAEVAPLLKGAVKAGASTAMVTDTSGKVIWICGEPSPGEVFTERLPLSLEGEVVGNVAVCGPQGKELFLKGLAGLLFDTINMLVHSNLKRMLTAETHTTVVNQSYEELLGTNRMLSISEARYRELAENLELKVRERTEELRRAHVRMLQQEKMASVGQLAAGLAHEINNPLGFISSNIHTLVKYITRFKEMFGFYRAAIDGGSLTEDIKRQSHKKWDELKLDFVSTDIDELIRQSIAGVERVKKIVSDLKGFSHIDDGEEAVIDINAEIDRTLDVLVHEIPADTEILKDYSTLPGFRCNPGLVCQAFLNIILNAIQARRGQLRLVISTQNRDNKIEVRFSDNGCGIPDNIRNRIFEPFYTTKEVGKGTGMGLTVAYEIIKSYHGTIELESWPDKGTTVIIILPINED